MTPPVRPDRYCPLCGADLQGEPIPLRARLMGLYAPGETHYSNVIGIEQLGIYDGILYWVCPACMGKWHRWPEGDFRRELAEAYIND